MWLEKNLQFVFVQKAKYAVCNAGLGEQHVPVGEGDDLHDQGDAVPHEGLLAIEVKDRGEHALVRGNWNTGLLDYIIQ